MEERDSDQPSTGSAHRDRAITRLRERETKKKNNRTAEEQGRIQQAKRKRGNSREAEDFPARVRESRNPTLPSSGSLTGHFS